MSDSATLANGSVAREADTACWMDVRRSRPAWQSWPSFRQWIWSSSDPSGATVNAQLLKERIINFLFRLSQASRTHWTISRRGGTHVSYSCKWMSSLSHSRIILLSYFGLKELVPCNVRGLDILSTPSGYYHRIDLWLCEFLLDVGCDVAFERVPTQHPTNKWELAQYS